MLWQAVPLTTKHTVDVLRHVASVSDKGTRRQSSCPTESCAKPQWQWHDTWPSSCRNPSDTCSLLFHQAGTYVPKVCRAGDGRQSSKRRPDRKAHPVWVHRVSVASPFSANKYANRVFHSPFVFSSAIPSTRLSNLSTRSHTPATSARRTFPHRLTSSPATEPLPVSASLLASSGKHSSTSPTRSRPAHASTRAAHRWQHEAAYEYALTRQARGSPCPRRHSASHDPPNRSSIPSDRAPAVFTSRLPRAKPYTTEGDVWSYISRTSSSSRSRWRAALEMEVEQRDRRFKAPLHLSCPLAPGRANISLTGFAILRTAPQPQNEGDASEHDSSRLPSLLSLLPASYLTDSDDLAAPAPHATTCVEKELDLRRLTSIHGWLWVAGRPVPPRSLHHQLLLSREIFITDLLSGRLALASSSAARSTPVRTPFAPPRCACCRSGEGGPRRTFVKKPDIEPVCPRIDPRSLPLAPRSHIRIRPDTPNPKTVSPCPHQHSALRDPPDRSSVPDNGLASFPIVLPHAMPCASQPRKATSGCVSFRPFQQFF